ncbi:MAG: Gmad2 immunoglobulin-like domain-containing protein [Patescibacteria group bacterium]
MKKPLTITLVIIIILALISLGIWYFYPQKLPQILPENPDMIVVSFPVKDSQVASPLSISGRARGMWYFEGSFPVSLKDDSGEIIAEGHVTAQGEWMTEEFVPFLGTLQFNQPVSGSRGILIFRKDNPSGLAQYDDAIAVPVRFK